MRREKGVLQMRPRTISVFGSSASPPESPDYQIALELGRRLAQAGFAVISGGYRGTMEAVSRGAKEAGGFTIGVTVDLFDRWGLKANPYLDVEIKFPTLFQRLHYLVTAGDAWIALPGGIGTLSEMALAWSFLQTGEIPTRPLLLLGSRWRRLLEAYIDPFYIREEDAALLRLVETPEEAVAALQAGLERPIGTISRPWG
ncbi:MAG: LOG family protein [Anaerolineae bacterium]|uniref:LOG family protein n=2 Tax=Thermoflexus sp. TaxID=1969742 RepID=UPI0025F2126F|nr:LOG family protein [Thermoflexus sp.]MCS7349909.1 LOG family protein [Thermoflexus sp.]MDW8179356.1 LOG family protein [Anaerolineae bacterium]